MRPSWDENECCTSALHGTRVYVHTAYISIHGLPFVGQVCGSSYARGALSVKSLSPFTLER